jgi:hypothetical protein
VVVQYQRHGSRLRFFSFSLRFFVFFFSFFYFLFWVQTSEGEQLLLYWQRPSDEDRHTKNSMYRVPLSLGVLDPSYCSQRRSPAIWPRLVVQ